jgi:hypothetical protein
MQIVPGLDNLFTTVKLAALRFGAWPISIGRGDVEVSSQGILAAMWPFVILYGVES